MLKVAVPTVDGTKSKLTYKISYFLALIFPT